MMAELFGKATGTNHGKGGSMHIADFSVGMLGANGVVAAGMPIAVGAAHALKIRGSREIVACFFGDGAINRGPFLEASNWAVIYKLPVLFVCEDNRMSATTPTGADDRRRRRRGARRAHRRRRPWWSTATTSRRWTLPPRELIGDDPRRRQGRDCCTRSPTASRATSRWMPARTAMPRKSQRARSPIR